MQADFFGRLQVKRLPEMTDSAFADLIGVSRQLYGQWRKIHEAGRPVCPEPEIIDRVAGNTDLSALWLRDGIGPMGADAAAIWLKETEAKFGRDSETSCGVGD